MDDNPVTPTSPASEPLGTMPSLEPPVTTPSPTGAGLPPTGSTAVPDDTVEGSGATTSRFSQPTPGVIAPTSSSGFRSLGQLVSNSPSETTPTSIDPLGRVTISASSNRPKLTQQSALRQRARLVAAATVALLVFIVLAGVAWYLYARSHTATSLRNDHSYAITTVPLSELHSAELDIDQASQLSINGQLRINNSFVLTPSDTPVNPLLGQFYLNSQNKDLYYYNGTTFVDLATGNDVTNLTNIVNGLGSVSKTTPGAGLAISGGKLNNTGVLSLQGTANQINLSASTGNITVSLPQDIAPGSSPTFAGVQVGSLTARDSDSGLNIGSASKDLTLQGANTSITSSANGFTTTLAFANPSSNNTLIVPDIGGTICTTVGNCGGGASVSLQPTSPGAAQTGNANLTGTIIAGQFQGDGSGLTNVNAAELNGQTGTFYQNASNINTGTLADARLSGNVTLKGNTFNGANELVVLDGTGALPALSGANLTNLNASNIASGTLDNNRLNASVTLQGNTFNGANQLVQLNGSGVLPALSGINLTNLNASNIASGTLAVARGGTGAGDAANARINLGAAASGANTDITSLAPASTLTIGSSSQQLILQGSITTIHDTDNGNTTSLNFTAPTGNNTITIPDASGFICLSNNNCLGGAGGGANTSLSNLVGVALNVDIQPAANGQTSLGTLSKGFANLYVADSSNTFTYRFTGDALTANKTITLPSFTGASAELCLSTGNCAGSGSSVTTTTGTIGTIPVYTGAQQIGNSIISQDVGATTVTVAGALTVNNQLNANGGIATNNANINAGTGTITGNGSGLTNLNGSNITTGTVADARLSGNVTLQGNTFNGNLQLVQLTNTGILPVLSGQNLTNLNASNLTSGTVSDNRLSANVALLNGTNVFSGTNNFKPGSDNASAFRIQNAAGSATLFNADTTGSGALTFGVPSSFSSTVAVSTLGSAGGTAVCRNGSNQLSTCSANPSGVTLQQAYNASTSPQIVLTSVQGGLVVQDASTPIGGNLFVVQNNGGTSSFLTVTANGGAFGSTANTGTLTVGQSTAGETVNIGTGTVATGNTNTINIGTSATGTGKDTIIIGNTNGASSTTLQGGTAGVTVKTPAAGSTTAFQVQDATAASTLFKVDSANNNIVIGGNNAGALQPWTTNGTTMPTGLVGANTTVYNGYIYEVGGSTGIGTGSNTTYYAKLNTDGSVGTWTTSANTIPKTLFQATAAASNGYLYVMGGNDVVNNINAVANIYSAPLLADGSVGSWTGLSNALPQARTAATSVVSNGYVYVIGGVNNTLALQSTVYYAPITANGTLGTWTTSTTALGCATAGCGSPVALENATSVVANGYVYVIGGTNGSDKNTVYYGQLNATTGNISSWSTTTTLPVATNSLSSVVANGYLYVLGGTSSTVNQSAVYYAKLNSSGTLGSWATNPYAIGCATAGCGSPVTLTGLNADVANGYVYALGGNTGGTDSPTIYYASTQRIQVGGSLDLVGLAGQTLNNPGGAPGTGSTGGSITAGDGTFVGNFQVQGQANFAQNVAIGNNLNVNGAISQRTTTDSTTALQLQNAAGATILTVDNTSGSGTTGPLITISGTTNTNFTTLVLNNAHYRSTQAVAPTLGTPSINCGSGPSGSASMGTGATDSAGSVTLTTGGSPTASCQVEVKFKVKYGGNQCAGAGCANPKSVVVTGASSSAALATPYVTFPATNGEGFNLNLAGTLAGSTAYTFYYWVVE